MDELTQAERALDLKAKLRETDEAIGYLSAAGHSIPAEAIEIRTILRRAINAENRLSAAGL